MVDKDTIEDEFGKQAEGVESGETGDAPRR